jgi:hypothetical protein
MAPRPARSPKRNRSGIQQQVIEGAKGLRSPAIPLLAGLICID